MHGGAKMTTKSSKIIYAAGLAISVIIIITFGGSSTEKTIGIVGSAIIFVLGMGFSFLIEQGEDEDEKIVEK
ncbi:hypothetical protein KKB43_06775 [Patescibacteria group bacterium]|nr:hypothetical protein [Patescibacteria group bacterium]MBU4580682.1 hypothetical protein [Patescibacteria group bacterium]